MASPRVRVLINHERVPLPGTNPPEYTAAFRAHEDAIAWTGARTREYHERYALRDGCSWTSNR